mmetsp:Transcript_474/g.699  ORF Transcript_474/g.699 Transcript_474/m.699 type:complete len:509 (-) Transcript_474:53-1579(-)|eukprot:CAMPEP_0194215238 /NCGR_PEP_ID=MMETSP0156-20130528/16895_1 /TAXON_ID=33649 /ORGANISM="Thalassionema nitzschioides, Strain L26-B" /LENGTH=508 /DNA_ID=CAMNT_0038943703 /DNA_START=228 /DNA_END=1754 /DNA_ORIENTATION=-
MTATIFQVALLLMASATATDLSSLDQLNGHRELTLYQDPCTGSWSNDVQTLKSTDCSVETVALTQVDEPNNPPIMECSIKSPMNPSLAQKLNTLEFWYAVEVTEQETASWLNLLEDKIYDIAFARMSFCIASGQRRQRRSLHSRRNLGILSVTTNPPDRHRTDVSCPAALDIGDNEYCYVIQGKLMLVARETDDVSYTFASMIEAIKEATAPNSVLLGSDISTVTNVTYLGVTQSDVENWIPPSVILPPGLDNNRGDFLPVDSRKNSALISMVTVGVMALLVLLFLFVWRRRHDDDSRDLLWTASDEDSNTDGYENRIGTGDPPGSFHHGDYHHFKIYHHGIDDSMDGQQVVGDKHQPYLSTNCRECHDTRVALIDDTRNLVLANSKELGSGHSGVNVHKCSSSTCKVCQAGFRNVGMVDFERFNPNEVKSNVIIPMEDIDEDLVIVETESSYSSEAYGRGGSLQNRSRSPPGRHYSRSALSIASEEDVDSEVVQVANEEDSVVPQIV